MNYPDNIKAMIDIEPLLYRGPIRYVEQMNELAAKQEIWWHSVWSEAKRMMRPHIGWDAEKEELQGSKHWDEFHEFLLEISTNCK